MWKNRRAWSRGNVSVIVSVLVRLPSRRALVLGAGQDSVQHLARRVGERAAPHPDGAGRIEGGPELGERRGVHGRGDEVLVRPSVLVVRVARVRAAPEAVVAVDEDRAPGPPVAEEAELADRAGLGPAELPDVPVHVRDRHPPGLVGVEDASPIRARRVVGGRHGLEARDLGPGPIPLRLGCDGPAHDARPDVEEDEPRGRVDHQPQRSLRLLLGRHVAADQEAHAPQGDALEVDAAARVVEPRDEDDPLAPRHSGKAHAGRPPPRRSDQLLLLAERADRAHRPLAPMIFPVQRLPFSASFSRAA